MYRMLRVVLISDKVDNVQKLSKYKDFLSWFLESSYQLLKSTQQCSKILI